MKKATIKNLTFVLALLLVSAEIFAGQIKQEEFKTYLRLHLFAPKEGVVIKKLGDKVSIRTLNMELFEELKKDAGSLGSNSKYFKGIKVNDGTSANRVASIDLSLRDEVELFHFYRDREKKYVMDFWKDMDAISLQESAIAKPKVVTPKIVKKPAPAPVKKDVTKSKVAKKVIKKAAPKPVRKKVLKKEKDYRDFRYGASFVWDYPALAPSVTAIVDLERKTPEYFYPIKDREYEKSDKEAHLQLNINLFRKKKWGLMYKSIKLFEKKYGTEEGSDINEYLKANAILRNNLNKGKSEPVKMAINMLTNIAERTKIYDLKKGVFKYLINYFMNNGEYIQSLKISKRFYVVSKDEFDIEESQYAAEMILYNLSRLDQVNVIRDLLKEKTIRKLIPKQTRLGYEMFSLLKTSQKEKVIELFEKNESSLVSPIHESILFNVAEAYFRTAKYEKGIKLFDKFITDYSHLPYAARARVRIGLCYEILEKDPRETTVIYQNAVNRSMEDDIGFEAKVRYIALRSVRKKVLTDKDREVRILLDKSSLSPKTANRELKKLLWLVRLRTFIVDEEFDKALSYLNAIPLTSFSPSEMRVFESDGAEIVYGIIYKNYKQSKYSKVIQTWEIYKDKYLLKVALDPLMNFVVGHSYIKLGLYNGFDRLYSSFEKVKDSPQRTFPIWNDRKVMVNSSDMLLELKTLRNIQLKNWDLAMRALGQLEKRNPELNKINYYKGIISYNQNKLKETVKYFERYISNQKERSIYDTSEIAEMMRKYTDAIYQLGMLKKFKKVAQALLKDTDQFAQDNEYMKKVKERIAYLLIEIIAGEETPASSLLLEKRIKDFQKNYAKSMYDGRVRYLLGVALVTNKKAEEGKKIFNDLINDQGVTDYIRNLARSELSLIKIKDRTI